MLAAQPQLSHPPRLAALHRSGLLGTPPEESYDRLTRLAAQLLATPVALLCLVEEQRQFLKSAVGVGERWLTSRAMPLEYSYCRHALASAQPLAISDARLDGRTRESPSAVEEGFVAYLGVPLLLDGEVLGTLCVLDTVPRQWSGEEVRRLSELAAVVQREVHVALAQREAHLQQGRLRAVVEAQQAIGGAGLDLERVMAEVVERTRALTGAAAGVVEIAEGEEMVYRAVSGTAAGYLGLRLRMATSISGLCVRTGEILRCDDSEADPRVDREACRRVGARSMVVVPLARDGVTVGVLKVYDPRASAFGHRDVETLQVMAGLLTSSLAAAQRFEEQRRLSGELRESRERYRSVFTGAREGFFLVEKDADGEFRYAEANPQLGEITGIRLHDFVGSRPADVFSAALAERVCALYSQAFQGEALEVEHTNLLPRGAVTTRTRFHPIRGRDGEVTRLLGITEDVTERRRIEDELKRSNRELQDFAYIASHDLQEPLRKVQAFGDRLRSRHAAAFDETGLDYLARMQGAAGRMQSLIEDLLAYSRVSSKEREFGPVALAEIAEGVVGDLSARVERSGGRVEVGALPVVHADRLQMRQLLQNLVGNALKFHRTAVPPVVHLQGCTLPDRTVELRVCDNGIGFAQEHAERIFSPFERLHGRSEFEGTGIGLAICRKIAERHGGGIRAEGTPGAGATFVVTLGAAPQGAGGAQ